MSAGVLCLGLETSCDETAASVVAEGRYILSSVVASQAELHARYGGVFPEVAARRHLETVVPVVREALARAGAGWEDLSLLAVTRGPGLVGSLLVGVAAAKAMAWARHLPLVGVHHLVAHVYAAFLVDRRGEAGRREAPGPSGASRDAAPGDDAAPRPEDVLPAVCLLVSGGHTHLFLMEEGPRFTLLGRTRDDAAGEAFDKVARLLGLPYPGGPALERLAAGGDPSAVPFPRGLPGNGAGRLDVSFSGLKTAVAVYLERERAVGREPRREDVAASFQQAVVDVLVARALQALERTGARHLLVAGGVAANGALRRALADAAASAGARLLVPPPWLCTDNAAMVAGAGYHLWRGGRSEGLDLDAEARIPLGGAATETPAYTGPAGAAP